MLTLDVVELYSVALVSSFIAYFFVRLVGSLLVGK